MSAGSVRAWAVLRIVVSASVRASGPPETTLRRLRMTGRCRYRVLPEKTKFVPVSTPMRRATCSMAVSGTLAAGRNRPMVWKIFRCTSKATSDTGMRATLGTHFRSLKLVLKSCFRSQGVVDQVALDKLLARGRSCGAHSFRTGNHNNAELRYAAGPRTRQNGDVAGIYTNLTDGPRAARGHAYRSKPNAYSKTTSSPTRMTPPVTRRAVMPPWPRIAL